MSNEMNVTNIERIKARGNRVYMDADIYDGKLKSAEIGAMLFKDRHRGFIYSESDLDDLITLLHNLRARLSPSTSHKERE